MSLIVSVSGIRGTIGGYEGKNLTPLDLVKFASAYSIWLKKYNTNPTIVIGRDGRLSGLMVSDLIVSTMIAMGVNVIDVGLSTTPSVEMQVILKNLDGGIILTASHNPREWNALKLLNNKGEFLSDNDGKNVLLIADTQHFRYVDSNNLGKLFEINNFHNQHIKKIIDLDLVNVREIKKAKFTVAIDCINSVGGIVIPELLKKLGVKKILKINCTPNGIFKHNPEPLPENLFQIIKLVKRKKVDLGFVVDPDVDRLSIICEDGTIFGEEYTLVAIADYILQNKPGSTVSNLSSTMALKELTEKYKQKYFDAPVGEVNVVEKMKEVNAVIGGEGNGGIIYPELHYGRDALIGIALFLSHLATSKLLCSHLREKYPDYFISKNKIELTSNINITDIFDKLKNKYKNNQINDIDGIKIIFDKEWVHLRRSNTEMIIRIYAESDSINKAEHLAKKIIEDIKEIIRNQVLKNLENN